MVQTGNCNNAKASSVVYISLIGGAGFNVGSRIKQASLSWFCVPEMEIQKVYWCIMATDLGWIY